jgi:hypothetical protein
MVAIKPSPRRLSAVCWIVTSPEGNLSCSVTGSFTPTRANILAGIFLGYFCVVNRFDSTF